MREDRCKICKVNVKDDNTLQPILVSFPHGTLLPEEVSSLSCMVCRNKSSKKQFVAIATRESNVYLGPGDTLYDDSNTTNICNTFIAIRNRKTNKIRLVESDNIRLSRFVAKQEKNLLTNNDGSGDMTIEDKYSNLHKSFGSKVKRRQTEQSERFKTDVNVLRDNLMDVVDTVDTKGFNEVFMASGSSFLPWCNRFASSVYEVYKIHDIITEVELDSMKAEALKILENDGTLNQTDYTPFFVQNLPQVTETDDRLQCVQLLLYANCILKFFMAPFNRNDSFIKACPFSQMIAAKLRQEFTMESDSKHRLRPISMRDKAISHVIVLGLLALNFNLDLKTIIDSTQMALKRLTLLSKAIGATTANKLTTIKLTLPLPNPPNVLANMRKPTSQKY